MAGTSKIWQGEVEFDKWIFSSLGNVMGNIVFAAKALTGSRSTDFSLSGGGVREIAYTPAGILWGEQNPTEGTIKVKSDTSADMRILARTRVTDDAEGQSLIVRATADNTFYLFYLAPGGTIQTYRVIAGTFTLVGSVADTITANDVLDLDCSVSGGTQVFRDVTHNKTITTSDANISGAGGYGLRTYALTAGRFGWNRYLRRMTANLSGTAISTTFDAGASRDVDTILVQCSLPAGTTGGMYVSAVASGSPSWGTVTALANGDNSVIFATKTGRYFQVQLSLGRGAASSEPAMIGSVAIAKGNDASSGGSSISYTMVGGGRGRKSTKIVVIPDSEFRRLAKKN